jgi:hypothetical protein
MQHQTFILKGQDILEPVSQFTRLYYQDSFLSEYLGGFLMVYEDYSLLNGNDIMICLRVDSSEAVKGIVKIEMISGGGSSSLIGDNTFGSEQRRINHFAEKLEAFSKEKGIELEL